MNIAFEDFFKIAMGAKNPPYPYQASIASYSWPGIVRIETGMGKTAGIILSWLYKRFQNDPETPRRLVYCLPMRVLVEQTAQNTRSWIENLANSNSIPLEKYPHVYVLMGGEIDADWDRYPERDAILIGTQDQLLSRALNRGYAMSRFRWPAQFGLLNNDCLWVMDEIQLMGSGLATTTQMEAFRSSFGTFSPVRSIWMSATMQQDWLKTIDFANSCDSLSELILSKEDKDTPSVKKRFEAKKPLERADCPANKLKEIAEIILKSHQKGTRTLVVVNTVKRAMSIYDAIKQKKPGAIIALLHSRFRPGDRQKALEKVLADPDKNGSICISTQVVEAGVDISATTLITDLAPWASLVQRFGRCNRYGFEDTAKVIWLEIGHSIKGAALPYTEEELRVASSILTELKDVGLWNLPPFLSDTSYTHVLRRKDIVDLFDTTPDLAGLDIDISRYIRESEDQDVQVFWRNIPEGAPGEKEPAPSRDELCSVSVSDLKALKDVEMWRWDHLGKRWGRQYSISPGMVLMLPISTGCYSPEVGWSGKKLDVPYPLESTSGAEESNDDDKYSSIGWQTLQEHTDAVIAEIKNILAQCSFLNNGLEEALMLAARWHDVGKVHKVFQQAMLGDPPEADTSVIWAKTGRRGISYGRRGFRHELASALAVLENGMPDIVAYLVASHHGKVRLSIRSLPHEKVPGDPNKRFARGIWDGDVLENIDLGGDAFLTETVLDLSYMEFGEGAKGTSWLGRMLALRDNDSLGPFRLAYLEALLRTADWRASKKIGVQDE